MWYSSACSSSLTAPSQTCVFTLAACNVDYLHRCSLTNSSNTLSKGWRWSCIEIVHVSDLIGTIKFSTSHEMTWGLAQVKFRPRIWSIEIALALIFIAGGCVCLQDDFKEGVAGCLSPKGGRVVISVRFPAASLPSCSVCVPAAEDLL